MKKDKRLWLDMCAGSELMDTQGETLSVEGADISELKRLNDNHGKGFFNSLGVVTESKKIFKAEDCETDRQKYYWEKIKAPYIYAKGYLHNDEDHPNARAAAAILRNIHRDDTPLFLKASVEGGVISRGIKDPTRLARTKIHSIALTFTPANNATLVEPLNVSKSGNDWEADKQLIKSVMHLAETNVPSFRHIERHASANTIHENIMKIQELAKSLGVNIEVEGAEPEVIMKNAVKHKIANNISKINKLVKAIKAANYAGGAINPTAQDKFQQGIGKLKTGPTVPNLSGGIPNKTKSASQAKAQNVLKIHANKAANDPKHLEAVRGDLISRGIDPTKVSAVIDKIQSHMGGETTKKSEDEDDFEKGEIGRALKNLTLAGAMALGANMMYPSKKDSKPVKPKREIASQPHIDETAGSAKHPDLMVNSKKMGYDERKPNAKKIFKEKLEAEKRKKAKLKLKKALTAGYGGAGAPTSLTGGGVFQSESLDDGRKKTKKSETTDGISYISCDNCGSEQAYMKYQVKCRKCNKNFPLSKLESHM